LVYADCVVDSRKTTVDAISAGVVMRLCSGSCAVMVLSALRPFGSVDSYVS